ncbi:hypothetical protein M407DRAFT_242404 [Tulasnella calospora MUT 4182]|uniref:DUF1772-domain-containing protein n=1 Tax=Tulasnella calospora MUT 4182 TaxID=1051891 RepID=A0A0C3LJ72_9AGAM|nr:hypothetical protein M407DRAFT_245474 [Tulasnella calospora MUT 4182]KIO30074.1 hypothetical protein M407DRAFT_242404 [Tulasnella calospora MUT 4182]
MPSYLTAFVRSSRLVGIVGTGLLAGQALDLSYTVLPALTGSALPADRLVVTWEKILHRADTLVPPMIIGSAVALLEGAYRAHVRDTPAATTFLGFTVARQLVIAAITAFAAIPYTVIWVFPVMNRLSVIAKNVEEKELMNETPYVSEEVVQKDVQTWGRQTAFRGMLFGTAFILSLTAV